MEDSTNLLKRHDGIEILDDTFKGIWEKSIDNLSLQRPL